MVEWDVIDSLEGAVDRHFLETVLAAALAERKVKGPLSVGLVITDDERIKELNLRYRGLDTATDVLSFPLQEYETPELRRDSFPQLPGEPLLLGDIVISYERAVEQAQSFGHSLERELGFLVVHGAMHLLGYDHEDPPEAQHMRQEEEAVLQKLGLTK